MARAARDRIVACGYQLLCRGREAINREGSSAAHAKSIAAASLASRGRPAASAWRRALDVHAKLSVTRPRMYSISIEGQGSLGDTNVIVHRLECRDRGPRFEGGGLDLGLSGRAMIRFTRSLTVARSASRSDPAARACSTPSSRMTSASSGRPVAARAVPRYGTSWSVERIQPAGARRPAEEIAGRDVVEGGKGSRSGGSEQFAGARRQGGQTFVSLAELLPQMQRALEVPRDRLVDLGLVRVLLDDPVGEPLVQIRPQLFREASVCGLEREGMREAPPAPPTSSSGCTRPRRSSEAIADSTSSGLRSGAIVRSAAIRNQRPSTDARSRIMRGVGSSRSSLAARSACNVAGPRPRRRRNPPTGHRRGALGRRASP